MFCVLKILKVSEEKDTSINKQIQQNWRVQDKYQKWKPEKKIKKAKFHIKQQLK